MKRNRHGGALRLQRAASRARRALSRCLPLASSIRRAAPVEALVLLDAANDALNSAYHAALAAEALYHAAERTLALLQPNEREDQP